MARTGTEPRRLFLTNLIAAWRHCQPTLALCCPTAVFGLTASHLELSMLPPDVLCLTSLSCQHLLLCCQLLQQGVLQQQLLLQVMQHLPSAQHATYTRHTNTHKTTQKHTNGFLCSWKLITAELQSPKYTTIMHPELFQLSHAVLNKQVSPTYTWRSNHQQQYRCQHGSVKLSGQAFSESTATFRTLT